MPTIQASYHKTIELDDTGVVLQSTLQMYTLDTIINIDYKEMYYKQQKCQVDTFNIHCKSTLFTKIQKFHQLYSTCTLMYFYWVLSHTNTIVFVLIGCFNK